VVQAVTKAENVRRVPYSRARVSNILGIFQACRQGDYEMTSEVADRLEETAARVVVDLAVVERDLAAGE
jgi:hypothetical protein